jgi:hypothetical protein
MFVPSSPQVESYEPDKSQKMITTSARTIQSAIAAPNADTVG